MSHARKAVLLRANCVIHIDLWLAENDVAHIIGRQSIQHAW